MTTALDTTEALTTPFSQTLLADTMRINTILVDREGEWIVVTFSKGTVDGSGFHEVFRDSHTFRNESDEDGEPIPERQFWTIFLENTRMAQRARAAAEPLGNGELLRDFFIWVLKQVGAA